MEKLPNFPEEICYSQAPLDVMETFQSYQTPEARHFPVDTR
jgi:hypothetical protein